MTKHRDASPSAEGGEGIHVVVRWTPGSEAARLGLVLAADDVGGVFQQTDSPPTFWIARAVGSGEDKWQRLGSGAGGGGGLTLSSTLFAADFSASAGVLHRYDGAATFTATMPANPSDNDLIGFASATTNTGGVGTIDFNGKSLFGIAATFPIPRAGSPGPNPTVILRFSAADDFWILDSSLFEFALQAAPNSVLGTDGTGLLTGLPRAGLDTTAFHSDAAGEIQALTAKTDPFLSDLVLIESALDSYAKRRISVENLVKPRVPGYFRAKELDLVDAGGDWFPGATAPTGLVTDPQYSSLQSIALQDTGEPGVGGRFYVPVGYGNAYLNFKVVLRVSSVPVPPDNNIGIRFHHRRLYERESTFVVGAWSSITLSGSFPFTGAGSVTAWLPEGLGALTLAGLGIAEREVHQFAISRIPPTSGGTMPGDVYLLDLHFELLIV